MFTYHCISENKSQVLIVDINKAYRLSYQYMEQSGKEMESRYQSRVLTTYEFTELRDQLTESFLKHRVPDWLIEKFESDIHCATQCLHA
jgi:hypothetical protein